MPIDLTNRDIIYVIISFLIVILNTVEAVLIIRCNSKNTFDKLLLSLAISDILVGLSVAAFKIIDLTTYDSLTWLGTEDCAIIFIASSNFSMLNLVLITVDRFLAVRFPIKHRILVTERRINTIIVLIWIVSAVSMIFLIIIELERKGTNESLFAMSGLILLIGAVMVVVYIKIFYVISKRTAKVTVEGGQGNTIKIRSLVKVKKGPHLVEKAVFITGGVVTFSFVMCTYPFAFDFLIHQSAHEISLAPRFLLLLNSLLNPLIYFFKGYLGSKRATRATKDITIN